MYHAAALGFLVSYVSIVGMPVVLLELNSLFRSSGWVTVLLPSDARPTCASTKTSPSCRIFLHLYLLKTARVPSRADILPYVARRSRISRNHSPPLGRPILRSPRFTHTTHPIRPLRIPPPHPPRTRRTKPKHAENAGSGPRHPHIILGYHRTQNGVSALGCAI